MVGMVKKLSLNVKLLQSDPAPATDTNKQEKELYCIKQGAENIDVLVGAHHAAEVYMSSLSKCLNIVCTHLPGIRVVPTSLRISVTMEKGVQPPR